MSSYFLGFHKNHDKLSVMTTTTVMTKYNNNAITLKCKLIQNANEIKVQMSLKFEYIGNPNATKIQIHRYCICTTAN